MSDDQQGVFTWDASAIDDAKDVTFGRVIVPVPLLHKPLKKNKCGVEYAEHSFIGDAISLTLTNGRSVPAIDHYFVLTNGLRLTYGQINSLASDFYGTDKPISDGRDPQECTARFGAAFGTLNDPSPRQPREAQSILAILQAEVDAVNAALHNGSNPSEAYSTLPDVSHSLLELTAGRPSGFPSYLGLALINWDRFGDDARKAYNTGHAAALQVAAGGDLDRAYAMNAFADTFLASSFSAGHLRTPRRYLHRDSDISADACAKLMDDEDNAIGLAVEDPTGNQWTAYGDKRALDEANSDNLKRCVSAVQLSVDEVHNAYKTGRVVPTGEYRAWTKAPTLASARSNTQVLAPLFTASGERRKDISPGTRSVAVALSRSDVVHVYHQNSEGEILESVASSGKWSSNVSRPIIQDAKQFTPLAAVSLADGAEIRVYYISAEENTLSEYCCTTQSVQDSKRRLSSVEVKGRKIILHSENSSIAAVVVGQSSQIRVYIQDEGAIREYIYDTDWSESSNSGIGYSGTGIAAVSCNEDENTPRVRVYYQGVEWSLGEHLTDINKASKLESPEKGQFASCGRPAIGSALSLSAYAGHVGAQLGPQAFWTNVQNEIVQGPIHSISLHEYGSLAQPTKVVGPLPPSTRFAVTVTVTRDPAGNEVHCGRLYYLSPDCSVHELYTWDGTSWSVGETLPCET